MPLPVFPVKTWLVAICLGLSTSPVPAAPWSTLVVGNQTEAEVLATLDYQRYVAQVTGEVPAKMTFQNWQKHPRPAVFLGTPGSNSGIDPKLLEVAGVNSQAYIIQESKQYGPDKQSPIDVVLAAGTTPEGAVHAIYGLLNDHGFGFYLGSEASPPALPDKLSTTTIVRSPVLGMRGVLPWYNFFNSPTTWDPPDHRALVDQLVRQGANFVGFHTYDDEPFAAYPKNGKWVAGKRLQDTGSSAWSTHPMATKDFAGGTHQVYATQYFGALTTREIDDARAIELEQNVLRDAIAYARRRGLHACIGFEANLHACRSADVMEFTARLNHVLDQYPDADYIWLWQAEGRGARGIRLPQSNAPDARPGDTTDPLRLYADARMPEFNRVVQEARANNRYFDPTHQGKVDRAVEAAQWEQVAMLAYKVLNQRTKPPRLILSGWGGEDRMLAAEYYDGLDKLLPKDIVFASLDFIIPRPRVDSIYHQLPQDRERWPIPWLEYDGDQWHPQPFVHTFESICRDVHQGGSQGLLGIHWRTREVEMNFGYAAAYAWNPALTASQFIRDYCRRSYGSKLADEMTEIETQLDKLGYRWVGGKGQAEYNVFTWGASDKPEKVAKLNHLLHRVESIRSSADPAAVPRLDWLIHNIKYVLEFDKAQQLATRATALLNDAASTEPAIRKALASAAVDLLTTNCLDVALQEYAMRLTTRGEYGVLATINTKAVPAWRALLNKACIAAEEPYTTPSARWSPEPAIIVPRLSTTAYENESYELQPIVLTGKSAFVHYRTLGQKQWQCDSVNLTNNWVYYAAIPAGIMVQPGVEFAFSFSDDSAAPFAYGPVAVTVIPKAQAAIPRSPAAKPASTYKLPVSLQDGMRLTWKDSPGVQYYVVDESGKEHTATSVPFYPVPARQRGAKLRVSGYTNGQLVSQSAAMLIPSK